MTLLYRLLGIPRTLGEVVEKADKRKGVPNVFVKRSRENTLIPSHAPYRYSVGVRLGLFSLTIDEWRVSFENYIPLIDGLGRLNATDKYAKLVAFRLADQLATMNGGRAIKVNGEFYNLSI